jgi:hypothetical protein
MLLEVVAVRIPVLPLLQKVVHVDEGHTGFHQPPGQQQVLSLHRARRSVDGLSISRLRCIHRPPIPLAHGLRLRRQVQRGLQYR